ncbi:MAG: DUF547 domain-containing protein [Acidobacteriota bacterium]|nr:DUF547 domain-containing protein [Acidobacteriota bacterium]
MVTRRVVLSLTAAALATLALLAPGLAAQGGGAAVAVDPLHKPLDTLLNEYVRDGLVYYGAVKQDRVVLDRYIGALGAITPATYAAWSRNRQIAFWLNAYNAFVLQTVIDHYPIRGRAANYPRNSIRQIPGAFDRIQHRAAGRLVTLDQIEQQILPTFHDARLYFALGRGAIGSGRLHSEAYDSMRLEAQLTSVRDECLDRSACAQIDEVGNQIAVSPIFSWDSADFVADYAGHAAPMYATRSPIERAVLAYVRPELLTLEKDFVAKNTFRIVYQKFDWRLNDMSRRD